MANIKVDKLGANLHFWYINFKMCVWCGERANYDHFVKIQCQCAYIKRKLMKPPILIDSICGGLSLAKTKKQQETTSVTNTQNKNL